MERVNLGKTAPELYKTVLELENLSVQKVKQIKVLTYLSNGLISRTFDEAPFRLAATQKNLRLQLVH
mgnify:CR=1 FL=1